MNKKLLIGIIIAILLAIGIGATVFLTQQQQDIRQRADEPDQNPYGKALKFNGQNGYALKTERTEYNEPFTLEGFIKPYATTSGSVVFSINPDGSNNACGDIGTFSVTPINDTEMLVRTVISQPGTDEIQLQNGATIPVNEWAHIALVFEASKSAHIYVNGVEVGNTELTRPFCADTTISMGSLYRGGSSEQILDPFLGEIDEVRLSKTARYTETFTVPTTPFVPDENTISLWHFDDSTKDEFTGNDAAISDSVEFIVSTLGTPVAPPACKVNLATCAWDAAEGATSYKYRVSETESGTIVTEGTFTSEDGSLNSPSITFQSDANKSYTCSVTPANDCGDGVSASAVASCVVSPTPTPTPTNTPSPTPTATGTPSPTATPTNTPAPTNTPTATPTKPPVATNTPTPTRPPLATSTPTNTPTVTNTPIPGVTYTPTPTMEAPGSVLQTVTLVGGIILTIIGGLVLFVL